MTGATDDLRMPLPERIRPVARAFFARPTLLVARELLGCLLVREAPEGRVVGRIVETEAYTADDPGSHAFRGKTPRNAPMFERAGIAYVYFTYGMHWMLNAVTERAGVAGAVLIRAVEPLDGLDVMRLRRGPVAERELCRGPGRLAKAFAIDAELNRADLVKPPLFVAPGERLPHEAVATTARVGLGKSQDDRQWRFVEAGSRWVSRFTP